MNVGGARAALCEMRPGRSNAIAVDVVADPADPPATQTPIGDLPRAGDMASIAFFDPVSGGRGNHELPHTADRPRDPL